MDSEKHGMIFKLKGVEEKLGDNIIGIGGGGNG